MQIINICDILESSMKFKRSIFILFCISVALSTVGCFGLLIDFLSDDLSEVVNEKEPAIIEIKTQENQTISDPGYEDVDDSGFTENVDDARDLDFPGLYRLDMSSVDAFIDDIKRTYNVVLLDERGYLSGPDGDYLMLELNDALALFTPDFIRALVEEYKEYDSRFYIILEEPSTTEFGITEWDQNLSITLHYDRDPEENGISAAVFAHELAHAVHFIIEEYIGEARSENELRIFNGPFDYVEDDYDYIWDYDAHAPFFAYDYGMYDYYEDFATIIEMLIGFPDDMLERFSDGRNEALFNKTIYLRELIYYYISDACSPVFTPLYEVEAILGAPAA